MSEACIGYLSLEFHLIFIYVMFYIKTGKIERQQIVVHGAVTMKSNNEIKSYTLALWVG